MVIQYKRTRQIGDFMGMREIRRRKKITLMQLSELTGIDYRNLSRYERGDRKLTLANAVIIAQALNVSIEELL